MYPEFFHIGPFALRAYGVFLAASFLIGLWLVYREAHVVGVDPERAFTLGFVLVLFGMVGGRIAFVLYHLQDFLARPLDIINPFQNSEHFGIAGLNLQGGLVGGLAAGFIYLRRNHLPIRRTLAAAAPAVAFGIFLSRIGCFLNGCCFGVPTDSFCGVQFPPESYAGYVFGAERVHPTQLYSAAYGLLLFFVTRWLNRRHPANSASAAWFLILEAAFRLAIEPLRYYESEMWVSLGALRINFNQLVAVGLLVVGVLMLWSGRRAKRKTP
jgi:phosphatidylglycerol:prolipoprotein diacylglycerol transferase